MMTMTMMVMVVVIWTTTTTVPTEAACIGNVCKTKLAAVCA